MRFYKLAIMHSAETDYVGKFQHNERNFRFFQCNSQPGEIKIYMNFVDVSDGNAYFENLAGWKENPLSFTNGNASSYLVYDSAEDNFDDFIRAVRGASRLTNLACLRPNAVTTDAGYLFLANADASIHVFSMRM